MPDLTFKGAIHGFGQENNNNNDIVFLPLGGVGEIGMNLGLYGYGPEDDRTWLIVDCGVSFAGPELPGIDVVVPDIKFLEDEVDNIAGMVIPTHMKTITAGSCICGPS